MRRDGRPMHFFQEVIHGLKEENGGTISTVEFANRLGKVPLLYQPVSPGVMERRRMS